MKYAVLFFGAFVLSPALLWFEYRAFWAIGPQFLNPTQLHYFGWFLVLSQLVVGANKFTEKI